MSPSTRHLYPSTGHLYPHRLRAGRAADDAAGGEQSRQLDGAWRIWERLRAFDQRYALYVDVVLALGLFLLCSGWLGRQEIHGFTASDLWFVAGLTLPLIFRRQAPMPVFLVIATIAFVQWLVTGPLLADAALLLALYTVAVESEWRQVAAAAVIVEAGVVMATARWNPTGNALKSFVSLTGLTFTALLAGIVVRALRSRFDWLAERAVRLEFERDQQASLAAAAERARIAREMHDVVSHNIQVMVTLADAATAASDPRRSAETIHEVSVTGRQALTDMRRMLGVLREEPTPAQPLPVAPLEPQPGLTELDTLVERVRGTGLAVSIEESGRPFAVSGAAGLTIYRIVQEALTNALKHAADPASVEVRLEYRDPDLSVQVTDDGRTPEGSRNGSAAGGGHGVPGMAERAAAFGGTLQAGPGTSGGWRVRATLRDCRAPVNA